MFNFFKTKKHDPKISEQSTGSFGHLTPIKNSIKTETPISSFFWNDLGLDNPISGLILKKEYEILCMDCGLYEKNFGMDLVIPREQWLLIHPDDGGVLCANCLIKRASKLPHVINLTGKITFAKDYE